MVDERKSFFARRDAKDILKDRELKVIDRPLLSAIFNRKPGEVIGIPKGLIKFLLFDSALGFKVHARPRKFLRHGPTIDLPRFHSDAELRKCAMTPIEMVHEEYQKLHEQRPGYLTGTRWAPFTNEDKIERRVSLEQQIEGAKILAYAAYYPTSIDLNFKGDSARKLDTEGAKIGIIVPSRTKGKPRYGNKDMFSIPLSDDANALGLVLALNSIISTEYRRNMERRSLQEGDRRKSVTIQFEAHDVAAYWTICEYYGTPTADDPEISSIPYKMRPFIIPTQQLLDLYNTIENELLVEYPSVDYPIREKGKQPYPTVTAHGRKWTRCPQPHFELLLQAGAISLGPKAAFYSGDKPFEHIRSLHWLPLERLKDLKFLGERPQMIQAQIDELEARNK